MATRGPRMILFYTARQRFDAYLLADRLKHAGIRAHVFNEHAASIVGDVPPDVAQSNVKLPPVLIGCGTRDQWYTRDKHAADLKTLAGLGVPVDSCVFDGGHEWGADFLDAAARFLSSQKV